MPSPSPDPRATSIAARYEAATAALASGDIERVVALLDSIELPNERPAEIDRDAWRAVELAHRRLHAALSADLGAAERELAELRRGQQVLRRMSRR